MNNVNKNLCVLLPNFCIEKLIKIAQHLFSEEESKLLENALIMKVCENDEMEGVGKRSLVPIKDEAKNPHSIKNLPAEDKPREKMMAKGQEALSVVELLAILINTGTSKKSALGIALELYNKANQSLSRLSRFSLHDLKTVSGIGDAKAITLAAALELGRRRQVLEAEERIVIKDSRSAADILIPILRDKSHEMFYVIYLNNAQSIIHYESISSGGTTATVVDLKVILKNAIGFLTAKVIVAHNHPSGNLQPSSQDIHLTKKLKSALELVDIQLIDHIIVGGNHYYSFADNGMI